MNKAYKFRIYPNAEQRIMFAKTFGCVRFVYNRMLADKFAKKKSITPAKYKEEFEWLKEVDSLALCNAQLNLSRAFENHRNNPKHFGGPHFKSKKNHQSYSTNNQKGSVRIESGQIKLPKVGWVKVKAHRLVEGTIKTVTISKTPSGKYFVSILTEYENQVLSIVPKIFLGLDYAMNGLFVASTGEQANYPKYFRQAQKKLRRVQKKFSRSKRESQNREKIRVVLSRVYEKVTNRRKDFLQKLSTKLVNAYDAIAIEDLDLKAMAKRKRGGRFSFGKSISDNGWAMFTRMLEYKLEWQGKTLVKIDKWYPSSQLCSECGYQNSETKNLTVREWTCPKCDVHHDRDHNAAINIKNEGMKILA
ncbi:MAG: transposase [Selenomonadaceae bacterium]|nr:transposase [Selenomonadaceae bacterium]